MIKKIISLQVCLFIVVTSTLSQDIFDYHHSEQYGDYLYDTEQYSSAIIEFERCLFLSGKSNPTDSAVHVKLMDSKLKMEDYIGIERHWKRHFHVSCSIPSLSKILLDSYIENHAYQKSMSFLDSSSCIPERMKLEYQSYNSFLIGDHVKFQSYLKQLNTNHPNATLTSELNFFWSSYEKEKFKKPNLAGLMSAIVPGAGKVYTKRYRDAIFAFVMTTASAFQSYRAFKKNGIDSTIGWVYAGISSGFYIGGIYGAKKSAKIYNDKISQKYEELLVGHSH